MKNFNSKLLIVDDDDGILSTLQILLRKYFHDIVYARAPQQITQLIRQNSFDLILLDMNFSREDTSGSDGLKWLHHIKTEVPACPVIMMTAFADIDLAIQALKEGASDFVVKPWDNEKLIAAIDQAIVSNKVSPSPAPTAPCCLRQTKEAQRIFMFLDLKSSTVLAEQLGHVQYFELLNDFFGDISQPVLDHGGEIYQYVGDEVVISWPLETPDLNKRSIDCFFAISDAIETRSPYYLRTFGVQPQFKAGVHCGVVSVGSMDRIKQEEVYTGEVLHIASRLEGLCNRYQSRLLISEDLLLELPQHENMLTHSIGSIQLRGKQTPVNLYAIDRAFQI
ncbi:MAG: response regulator [Bacteroidota bacterium]